MKIDGIEYDIKGIEWKDVYLWRERMDYAELEITLTPQRQFRQLSKSLTERKVTIGIEEFIRLKSQDVHLKKAKQGK